MAMMMHTDNSEMSNAWLVRPNPQGSDRLSEFLKQNIIAIGWPGIGSLENASHDDLTQKLSAPPYNYRSLELGNISATIDIFVNRMAIGDHVLVPYGHRIYFARIESDYMFDEARDDESGYPHQRRVKWHPAPIPRSALPMSLRNALKMHRAAADLTKHSDVIHDLATGQDVSECSAHSSLLKVEYPLRPDLMVTVEVPTDITRNEALRLGEFVRTIYFEAE